MVGCLKFDLIASRVWIIEKCELAEFLFAQGCGSGKVLIIIIGAQLIFLQQLINAFAADATEVFVVVALRNRRADVTAMVTDNMCWRAFGHLIPVRGCLVVRRPPWFSVKALLLHCFVCPTTIDPWLL